MKKGKMWIFLGIVVMFAICILVSLLVLKPELEKSNFDTNTNNDINYSSQELDINSDLVQSLYKMVNPSDAGEIIKELYGNEYLTNDYILAVGAMEYIRDNISIDDPMIQNHMFTATISKETLRKYIYKVFGNIDYQDASFNILNFEYGVCGFTYQPEIEQYISLNGCGGSNIEYFLRKVVSARQEKNYIYIVIVEKSVYLYNDWNDYISRKYVYKDCSKEEMIDYQETDSSGSYQLSIDSYMDQASTYEYVFENNNGQYIFKKLQKK